MDGDTLWVTGEDVAKIDIGLRREVDFGSEVRGYTHGVVVAEGSLWVAVPEANTTLRLDPETGDVEHRFGDLPGSRDLAYGDGAVWTVGWSSPFGGFTGSGGVNRIDPGDERHHDRDATWPSHRSAVRSRPAGGFGWTSDPTKGVVYQLDQGSRVVATRPTGRGATIGAFDDGIVWVGNSDVGTVSGVDAVTGARRTFRFEHPVQGVAAGAGMVMVTLGPGPTYEDVIDGVDGTVARLVVPAGFQAAPDPATLFEDIGFWVEFATCAKLLNHPDARGT